MSKPSMILVVATCLLAIFGGVSALYQAVGNGPNQSPPLLGNGGSFVVYVSLDPGATQGSVYVMLTNVTDYLTCQLRYGNASSTGSVVVWVDPIASVLVPTPPQFKSIFGSVSFVTNFTAATLVGALFNHSLATMKASLDAGHIYVSVSTEEAPAGLLRQQLMPVSEVYTSMLEPQNVKPNVTSATGLAASGSSTLVFSPDFANATMNLTVSAVTGFTMAHIHMGNSSVVGGPVLLWINPAMPSLFSPTAPGYNIGMATFSLTFNGSSLSGYTNGSTNLMAFASMARSASLYANVHTKEYPGGVIRGQYMISM